MAVVCSFQLGRLLTFFFSPKKLRDDRRQMRLEGRNYERVSGVDIGDHGNSCRQDWAVDRVER